MTKNNYTRRKFIETAGAVLGVSFFVLFSAGCGNTSNQSFQYTVVEFELEEVLVFKDLETDEIEGELCLEVGDEFIPAQAED